MTASSSTVKQLSGVWNQSVELLDVLSNENMLRCNLPANVQDRTCERQNRKSQTR